MAPASCQEAAAPGELEVYDAIPVGSAVRVRVGERRQFSVWVRGEGLQYQWLLDGGVVSDRRSWAFAPQPGDVGPHAVSVVVDGSSGRVTRTWKVQVEIPDAAAPPSTTSSLAPVIVTATTSSSTSTARPTTSTSSTSTSTTVRRATTTVRATTTLRPTTLRPTTTSTSTTLRATTTTPPDTAPIVTTTTLRAVPTTTLARTGTISESDVRELFKRYESAWRNHDINGLQSLGQVATEGQADALESYFDSVKDLDVEVAILSITTSGDEARVRFIRRDRFRDPGGTRVTKESPVIEKRVIRTPGGLRLAPMF